MRPQDMNPTPSAVTVDLHGRYGAWAVATQTGDTGQAVTVWVRGQAWCGDTHLPAQQLAETLCRRWQKPESVTFPALRNALLQLNGHFAAVAHTAEAVIAATDRSRSIPLFYGQTQGRWLLSDDARRVRAFVSASQVDPDAVTEFLLAGYVTGSDTLYCNVKQVRPSQIISIPSVGEGELTCGQYYRYVHDDSREESEPELRKAMAQLFERVFDRFLRSMQGRRIVVPLSGGLDSRLIVTALKQAGARDVVCFTYGAPGNRDSVISGEVARRLGYEWHFVPYSSERWRTWGHSDTGRAYLQDASGLCSLAHLQDWPAVMGLKAAGVLQTGDVIAPGHTPIGQYIPPDWGSLESFGDVINGILAYHYDLWKWPPGAAGLRLFLEHRIRQSLGIDDAHGRIAAGSACEQWDAEERQAKFIVNSVRAYELLGYDWRLPICDHEVWDFDAHLPLRLRFHKHLYESYLRTVLFKRFSVDDLWMSRPSPSRRVLRERLPRPLLEGLLELRRTWLLRHDTRLGGFTASERFDAWRKYRARFGHGARNLTKLLSINSLASAYSLPLLAEAPSASPPRAS